MYKERISNFLNAVQKTYPESKDAKLREMLYGMAETALSNFKDYVNRVYEMETQISIARFRETDPVEYRETVGNLDKARRNAHEAAISSVNMMNRACGKLGVAPVYDGPNERAAIGDFCGQVVNEYFASRSGRTISREDVQHALYQERGEEGFERG